MGTHILGYQNWISPLRHAILGIALMGLAACGPQKFDAQVSRFNQMPVPQGQSFTIKGVEPGAENRLQFQYYAKMVADNMIQQGYSQATTPANAQMTVQLGFKMDGGREKVTSTPSMGPSYAYPSRFGYRGGFAYGFNDPFIYGAGYNDVESYTVYSSELDMQILNNSTNRPLFQGRAVSQSRSNDYKYIVPNLIEVLFTNFPGNNGETIQISVKPQEDDGPPSAQ